MIPSIFDSQTNGFITQWTVAGDATARTITLPLVQNRTEGALAYNCTVNWGDGSALSTVTSYNDASRVHTYTANGTYNVEVRGTCEGWSFNDTGDKVKIVKVIYWGDAGGFNGFKYLKNGFHGCSSLTSIGTGPILPSGTGIGIDGFNGLFYNCTSLAAVPPDLFRYNTAVSTNAFRDTFNDCYLLTSIPADLFRYNTAVSDFGFMRTFVACIALTSIPADLFRYNTAVGLAGFQATFSECHALVSIPVDLFRYNTALSDNGFVSTFSTCNSLTPIPTDLFRYNTLVAASGFQYTFNGCTSLTSIPVDLFKYNVNVSSYGFNNTFNGCTSLTSIPTDLFRYNTAVASNGFNSTFYGCTSLTSLPTDLFRYNTAVTFSGFTSTFQGCSSLATIPADLFRYNTACVNWASCFQDCVQLQVLSNLFYEPGEEATRFLNQAINFSNVFNRTVFSGTQGTAPNLWICDFGEKITLSTAPATDWAPGDVITGQTSGATVVVVSKVSSLVYKIKQHFGTFTLGEIVGVTGVPVKLAAQDGTHPTFSGTPTSAGCFGGAGNSLTSLNNYASIPLSWE